jgi:NADPH2:quinone reductase
MRALVLEQLKGPDGFAVADRPAPTPGPDDVLIEVSAAGVAFPELLISKGAYQDTPELPYIAGQEVAGVIRSSPEGSEFSVGDRVWASCGRGGFAELVAVPSPCVFPLHERLSFTEGAAIGSNYSTAIFALRRRGHLQAGETVLILGAGGGLGTASAAVAKALGARVIGVVSTAQKADAARLAGAEEVVVGGDWREPVLELTGGRGVDVVADIVGGEQTLAAVRTTAPEGRVLILGFAGGEIHAVKVNRLLLRNISVVGVGLGAFSASESTIWSTCGTELTDLIASGLRPVIGSTYRLEEGAEALRQLDARKAIGKIVLTL